jgi:hypothetical protein
MKTRTCNVHQLPLELFHRLLNEEDLQQPTRKYQRQRMLDLMPKGLAGVVSACFSDVEIAEQEIAKAQKRHPVHAEQIWQSFGKLMPSELLRPKTEKLYRAFCRELLDRIATGQPLAQATYAELACIFCATSLASPLNQDGAAAYWKVFKAIYPNALDGAEYTPRESYEGRALEIIHQLQRKHQIKRGY